MEKESIDAKSLERFIGETTFLGLPEANVGINGLLLKDERGFYVLDNSTGARHYIELGEPLSIKGKGFVYDEEIW